MPSTAPPARAIACLLTLTTLGLVGCDETAALAPTPDGSLTADGDAPDTAPPEDGGAPPDLAFEAAPPLAIRTLVAQPEPVRLDLLWVVDDSSSMCAEQVVVPDEIDAFAFALLDALPALDLALTTISTDMTAERGLEGRFVARPAPSLPTPGCIDLRNGLPYVPATDVCEARALAGRLPAIARYGVDGDIGSGCPDGDDACYREQLRFTLDCMTTLGVRGDDFAAGLAALDTATACDGPNADILGTCGVADPAFFRPGAARAIMIVADEDDCSPSGDFPRDDPADCAYRADLLADPLALADRLGARGDTPLAVFPWIGPATPAPVTWRPYVESSDGAACDPETRRDADHATWAADCCRDGVCVGPPRPTCTIGREGATAAPRYAAFAAALGDPATPSLCAEGVGASLAEQVAAFAAPLPAEVCLDPLPTCRVADRPCATDLERADPSNYPVRVAARCLDRSGPGTDCDDTFRTLPPDTYEVVDSPACGGVAVRTLDPLPAAARLRVQYDAPLPSGEPAADCDLPPACAARAPGVGVGYTVEATWACARQGGGCGTAWCVANDGAPYCTIDCDGPEGCPIGFCQPLGSVPCGNQGPCFCAPDP